PVAKLALLNNLLVVDRLNPANLAGFLFKLIINLMLFRIQSQGRSTVLSERKVMLVDSGANQNKILCLCLSHLCHDVKMIHKGMGVQTR
ncbi:MAG: hypothetical protein AMJ55_12575, partial [Gammaproteobacteria bacterium SG8_15]